MEKNISFGNIIDININGIVHCSSIVLTVGEVIELIYNWPWNISLIMISLSSLLTLI